MAAHCEICLQGLTNNENGNVDVFHSTLGVQKALATKFSVAICTIREIWCIAKESFTDGDIETFTSALQTKSGPQKNGTKMSVLLLLHFYQSSSGKV